VLTLVSDGLRRCLRGKGRPAVEMGSGGANGWCGSAFEHYWKLAAGVGSGEEGCRPFIGRVGRFGGGDFSLAGRSPAAALGAGRARSPGDGTARAGAEVVEQLLGLFKRVAQGW
jgi:hypothetical protein